MKVKLLENLVNNLILKVFPTAIPSVINTMQLSSLSPFRSKHLVCILYTVVKLLLYVACIYVYCMHLYSMSLLCTLAWKNGFAKCQSLSNEQPKVYIVNTYL